MRWRCMARHIAVFVCSLRVRAGDCASNAFEWTRQLKERIVFLSLGAAGKSVPVLCISKRWGGICGHAVAVFFMTNLMTAGYNSWPRCSLFSVTAGFVAPAFSQARASWQWYNFYEQGVLAQGRSVLRLNIDETSIQCCEGRGLGTVFRTRQARLKSTIPKNVRKRFISHVAVVCDCAAVQKQLPQYVVGNKITFLLRDWEMLQRVVGDQIVICRCPLLFCCAERVAVPVRRQDTAWVNALLFARIICHIGRVLKPYLDQYQPILLMDALPTHVARPVQLALRAAKILPVIVPARLTFAMQPLDTHVFLTMKCLLREMFDAQRIGGEHHARKTLMVDFVIALRNTVRIVFGDRCWEQSFDENGYGWQQSRITAFRLAELEIRELFAVSSDAPALDDVALCLSTRSVRAATSLWKTFVSSDELKPLPARKRRIAPPVREELGRTRSETRGLLERF